MKKFLTLTLCISSLLISNSLIASDSSKGTGRSFFQKAKAYAKPAYQSSLAQAAALGVVSGIANERGFLSAPNTQYIAFGSATAAGAWENRDKIRSSTGLWRYLSSFSSAVSRGFIGLGSEQLYVSWRQGNLSSPNSKLAIGQSFLLGLFANYASREFNSWQHTTNNERA